MDIWELVDLKAFFVAALVFIPLERLTALYAEQKIFRAHWKNDILFILANSFLIKIPVIAIFSIFLAMLYKYIPSGIHTWVSSQPLWLQVFEVVIIADTGFYLAHRTFHTVPSLWRFHAIHHSVEEMDWLAAFRIHPVDHVITQSVSLLPVFALGFSGSALAIYAFIYQWLTLLIHANTRIRFGPLRWIMATPQFHHWHHADQPHAYNKNFAAQLPIIDLLFGTLHLPKDDMPKKYGVDEDIPQFYPKQLIYPFIRRSIRVKAPENQINVPEWKPNDIQN